MKTMLTVLAMSAALVSFTGNADAKGCINGALVGGVAGHLAGHGKMGAAAGCAVGHHNANKKQNAANQNNGSK